MLGRPYHILNQYFSHTNGMPVNNIWVGRFLVHMHVIRFWPIQTPYPVTIMFEDEFFNSSFGCHRKNAQNHINIPIVF